METPECNFKPVLSVITPISKMAGRLENLTTWLEEISYLPVEVIIVHDVQDEDTGPELDALVSSLSNPRIKLIHKFCGSPGAARNLGFSKATAGWISFWDSDDRPKVKEFFDMVIKGSERRSDICVGSYVEITPRSMKHHLVKATGAFDSHQLLHNPGVWRMAFNREFTKNAKFAEYRMAEDQYFLCSLDLSSSNCYLSDKSVYEYYSGFGNQLTKSKAAFDDIPSVLKLMINLALSADSIDKISFIDNVIARVMLTGVKNAKIKVKIEIIGLLISIQKLRRRKILQAQVHILKARIKSSFIGKKPSSIHVKLYGGIGNQLFQLACGLAIRGNRKLILDLDLNSSDGAIVQFYLPNGTDVDFYKAPTKKGRIFLKLCNLNLRLSTYTSLSFMKETLYLLSRFSLSCLLSIRNRNVTKVLAPRGLGYSDLSSSVKHLYLVGYAQSYIWSENSEVCSQLAKMRLRKSSKFLDSMISKLESAKVLGVHVRLGDYLRNPQFGQLSENYYRQAIQQGLEVHKFESIWVFSNDMSEARLQLKFLDELGLDITWVDDSNLSAPELMMAISRCSGLVLANSTFGWWSARLSENSTQYVSIPNPWFANIDSPRLLSPENWNQNESFFEKPKT